MTRQRLAYLIFVVSLLFPLRCLADATLDLYATFHSIGIIVDIESTDDGDGNALAEVEYRTGSDDFKNGFPLARISNTRFVGSLFMLQPGVVYDVRVTIFDPDGGPINGRVMQQNLSTRSEITTSSPTSFYYTTPTGTSSSCIIDAPCSLSRALQLAQPGEAVILREGVYYQGEFSPSRSGTKGAPIIIKGYEGETAVLDGADPATFAWANQGGGVYSTTLNSESPHVVIAGGQRLFPYISLGSLQGLEHGVPGFYSSATTLYVHLENNTDPNDTSMTISRYNHAFYLSGVNHIRFSNMTFRHYGRGSWAKAIYLNDSSENVIENCIFAYNDLGIGLKRGSHRNVIQDNEFMDTIFNWPWGPIKEIGGLEDGGVSFYDPCTGRGNVIRRNVFHDDFDGFGVCPEGTAGDPTNETDVYENIIYNMGDDGVETDGRCSNVRLWKNTFYDVLIGISFAPVYDGPVYAIRNLIYRTGVGNNSYPGSAFKFNSGYSTSGPMYLFHNTSDAYYQENSGIQIKSPGSWANIYARNNIWSGTNYAISNNNTSQPIDFDYDGLFTTMENELVYWGSGSNRHMRDLLTFQQLTGQELNGFWCDPEFADSEAADYTLAASGCLIDKGVILPGINDDFSGIAPDIGAFEYVHEFDLEQVLSILQVLAGMSPEGANLAADGDNDGMLGVPDAISILQLLGDR